MKTTALFAAAIMLAASLVSAQDDVKSVNVVGYNKVTVPPSQLVMKSVPFDAFDETLLGVFGTNQLVRGGKAATNADKVYLWNSSTLSYGIFAQKDADKQFYDVSNWSGSPTNPQIKAGSAFWIESAGSVTNEITFMGEVVMASTQKIDVVEGLNMMAYPFSASINIDDLDFVGSGANTGGKAATNADKLYLWNSDTLSYTILAIKDADNKWYDINDWNGAPVDIDLELGTAFWFERMSGGTMTWSETNKYLNNLK